MDALTTCLWFDTEGEEAARFYTEIFPNSSVGKVTPYPTGDRAGQTMTVDFVIEREQVRRSERRAGLQLQRVDLVHGAVRGSGGGRPLLDRAY